MTRRNARVAHCGMFEHRHALVDHLAVTARRENAACQKALESAGGMPDCHYGAAVEQGFRDLCLCSGAFQHRCNANVRLRREVAIPSPSMLHSRGDLEAGPTLTRPSFGPMPRRLIAGQSASSTTRAALRLEGHSQTMLVRDLLAEAAHVRWRTGAGPGPRSGVGAGAVARVPALTAAHHTVSSSR